MTEPQSPEPREPSGPPQPVRAKLTPARSMGGDPRDAPREEAEAEVPLEVDGVQWTVRVLGRSGRASGAPAPLLLLGFWKGDVEGDPSLEALVLGTSLTDLSERRLEQALSSARVPPDPEQKRSFFAESAHPRRR